MRLIDTHCHLYLKEFESDLPAVMQRAKNAGVEKFCLPAIDSEVIDDMLKLEELYPEKFFLMMGLHPGSVKEYYKDELKIVEDYLHKRKFIAVGEIGLDFYWDKTFIKEQYDAFHNQIEIGLNYNLPIVVHSRNATDECIEVVKQYSSLKGVFHCFSGNTEQAENLIELGFLLGIGGVVTFKNSGLDKVIEQIGLNHVIIETDAPYLAPVPFRGKRNVPGYLKYVIEKLSLVSGKESEQVAKITTQNAINLFNLS